MSSVKVEFYEDGKIKSMEMHCLLLSGRWNYSIEGDKKP